MNDRQYQLFLQEICTVASLSRRTVNAIGRMGLCTKLQVERAVKDRTLHPSNPKALGFGAKALKEVRAWLGLKPELTGKDVFLHRARCVGTLFHTDRLTLREVGRVMRMSRNEAERHLLRYQRKNRVLEGQRVLVKGQAPTMNGTYQFEKPILK